MDVLRGITDYGRLWYVSLFLGDAGDRFIATTVPLLIASQDIHRLSMGPPQLAIPLAVFHIRRS